MRWIIAAYKRNRAAVGILALLAVLEVVFILHLLWPSLVEVGIRTSPAFEMAVLLALAELLYLFLKMLDLPKRICKNEQECQEELRRLVRADSRAMSLHVFSSGIGSRLSMLQSVHEESHKRFSTEVLMQAPEHAPDRRDAKRIKEQLAILARDHAGVPVEVRSFTTPATVRALLVCAPGRRPIWGVVSWYTYERTGDAAGIRVVGQSNPAIVLSADTSRDDSRILQFLMDLFESTWKACEGNVVFSSATGRR